MHSTEVHPYLVMKYQIISYLVIHAGRNAIDSINEVEYKSLDSIHYFYARKLLRRDFDTVDMNNDLYTNLSAPR